MFNSQLKHKLLDYYNLSLAMLAQEIGWYLQADNKMTDEIYHSEIQCYPAKYENTTF